MTPDQQSLLEAIVDCVPAWYIADTGPVQHAVRLGEDSFHFYSFSPNSPRHDLLLQAINAEVGEWARDMPSPPTRGYLAAVREKVALHWLRLHEPGVVWNRFLSHLDELAYRTHENRRVTRNLIVRHGQEGFVPVDDPDLQSVLDPLAGSPQTYLAIGYQGRYLEYGEVLYGGIEDTEHYDLHPEFLQPLKSQLGPRDYSLHLTERGDSIILGAEGMLAAHRRGKWYIYDAERLQNDLFSTLGEYLVSAHLFGVVLDLSYGGLGALLVYDPNGTVLEQVINADEAVIGGPEPRGDKARRLLAGDIGPIRMSDPRLAKRKKRLFLEIASLDGAVIFDDRGVLAFGAMIRSNPGVGGHFGARTTAMHSAYLWGGRPIKISADGEIVIPFPSRGPDGWCEAALAFG